MQPDHSKLLLQSNKELRMYGDLDVLILLKMHFDIPKKALDEVLIKLKDPQKLKDILGQEFYKTISDNTYN